jgi:glycosyltransferase involved in cell wall biosynthesis
MTVLPTALESSSPPLISIVMPTHNAGRYITTAIESVLQQTYPNWELLVIDDASTDNTQALMQTFTDTRIRYHRTERVGHPAGVRNIGLKLVQGEFVGFLDSDDCFFPETLEKLSAPLRQDPHLTAVYGFSANIDDAGNELPASIRLIPDTQPRDDGKVTYHLPSEYHHSWRNIVTGQISCQLPALLLRRQTLERVGLFNESLRGAEDFEFYVRLYLDNYDGVSCLSDYVYHYRLHAASLTKAPEHCQRLIESCMQIMEWLFTQAALSPEMRQYRSQGSVACYRYMARERLLHKQPSLCRSIIRQAFRNPHIHFTDVLKKCGPLYIRSFLPSALNQWLVQWRSNKRTRKHETSLVRNQWVTTP